MPLESVVTNPNPFEHDPLIDIPPAEKEMIRDFYHRTIAKFAGVSLQAMKEEVRFIVVGHLVPTLPFYLEALSKIGTIAAVIQKGSVPDPKMSEWIVKWLGDQADGKGIIVNKDLFKTQYAKQLNKDIAELSQKKIKRLNLPIGEDGKVQEGKLGVRELLAVNGARLLKEWVGNNKGIIIDIGGYFSHSLKALQREGAIGSQIIGVVEDTENGHQLYERAVRQLTIEEHQKVPPIITVARSEIKDSEDYNVGKAITDAVDHILRTEDYTHLAESKVILVIGYGKIGSAAARVAAEKTRGPVLICEINPVRRLKASAHSFAVVDIEKGLSQADVIICCTGKNCLTHEHLKMIKNNAYIASCTSRDQEFHETFLSSLNKTEPQAQGLPTPPGSQIQVSQSLELMKNNPTQAKEKRGTISRYTIAGKTINLLNDGNSVNFVEKAVHGYFIHGVLASLATAAIRLYLEPPLKPNIDKPLKKGVLNDFNDLVTSEGLSYQSVIADILMREKLRKEPIFTNLSIRHRRHPHA